MEDSYLEWGVIFEEWTLKRVSVFAGSPLKTETDPKFMGIPPGQRTGARSGFSVERFF